MTEPLYIAHDGALGVDLGEPAPYAVAARRATDASLAAGKRGERVTVGHLDRFTVKRAPASATPARTYSALEAEAALCLWEAMIDARLESTLPALDAAWDASGAHTMRHHALDLAPFALQVYDALPESIRKGAVAYDYEIIPAILAAIRWTGAGYVLPPVDATARDVAAALVESV